MGTSIEQYRSAIGCFIPGGRHGWKRGAREESRRKLYGEVVVEMMGERSRATILLLLLMGIVATIGITSIYTASTSTGGSLLVTRSFKIQNPHFSLVVRMLLLLAGVESHPGPRTMEELLKDRREERAEKKRYQEYQENKRNRIVFQEVDGETCIMGGKDIISKIRISPDIKVSDLINLISAKKEEEEEFHSTLSEVFPKMDVKYKSKEWKVSKARKYLLKILTVRNIGVKLCFGGKKYREGNRPEGWPSEIQCNRNPKLKWDTFEGPSKCSLSICNIIIESFLRQFLYDPTCHDDHSMEEQGGSQASPRPSVVTSIHKSSSSPPLSPMTPLDLSLMSSLNLSMSLSPPSLPPQKKQKLGLPELFKEIKERHKKYFSSDLVVRQILGNGSCLYGCVSFHMYRSELHFTRLRMECHKFLKDTWAYLGEEVHRTTEALFPLRNLTLFGDSSFVSFENVQEWINFLQDERSLTLFTEMEIESQNVANYFGITVEIYHYNKNSFYHSEFKPKPEIHQFSPWIRKPNPSNLVVYHEIDSHFEIIVQRP